MTVRAPGAYRAAIPGLAHDIARNFDNPDFARFTSDLDGGAHGMVHVRVGADVGRVVSAAYDPLFWLHHAQVDKEPCVLRVLSPAGRTVAQFDLYGRGEGSRAAQDLVLNLRLDARAIDEAGLSAGDELHLVTETLDGERLNPDDVKLELVAATPRPAG